VAAFAAAPQTLRPRRVITPTLLITAIAVLLRLNSIYVPS
jgi:hypothetical protein